jgi:mono/diheme cytochrome c family protein
MKPARSFNGLVFAVGLLAAAAAGAADPESIARGKYIFQGADCIGCHGDAGHGSDPVGGLGLDTPFGTFRAPNITPDKAHGIGAWSRDDFKAALRNGVGRDGQYLFPVFPYTSFTRMSDRDMEDLYAYLMSRPAVPVPNKPHEAKPPFSWRPLLVVWRALFFSAGTMPSDPARGSEWNRGNYLVHAVVHCEECHTPRNPLGAIDTTRSFSGNVGGPDKQNAPNITSDVETGIGGWSIEDIQVLLKTGMTPDSDLVGSGMKAVVQGTSKLTDADRRAIAVYLKSVAPIHVDLPPKAKVARESRGLFGAWF